MIKRRWVAGKEKRPAWTASRKDAKYNASEEAIDQLTLVHRRHVGFECLQNLRGAA